MPLVPIMQHTIYAVYFHCNIKLVIYNILVTAPIPEPGHQQTNTVTVHILLCLCPNPPHLFPLLNVPSNVSPGMITFPHRCLLKHATNETLPARGKIAK